MKALEAISLKLRTAGPEWRGFEARGAPDPGNVENHQNDEPRCREMRSAGLRKDVSQKG